jgi:uncharacterized protein YndB with AHSA1/START domain
MTSRATEDMTNRKVTHAAFTIERSYPASPARVFHALSDKAAKSKWFVGPDEWAVAKFEIDFRIGGREVNSGGPKGGTVHTFNATYLDIVENQRIIYAYDMHLDDVRISVSLATIELLPEGQGTRLKFTEQGAFLDGYDDAADRERGTRLLLDALGKAVS